MEGKINLGEISPNHYAHLTLQRAAIMRWFKNGYYWRYKEGPGPVIKPHAVLDGFCISEAFNYQRLLRYPNIAEILGRQLVRKLRVDGPMKADWVVSSSYTPFGYEVARAMGAVYEPAKRSFSDGKIIWRSLDMPSDAKVLIVENSVVNIGIVDELMRAILVDSGRRRGWTNSVGVITTIGTIVHYSAAKHDGFKIVSLKERVSQVFRHKPGDCPYCKIGSPVCDPEHQWDFLA